MTVKTDMNRTNKFEKSAAQWCSPRLLAGWSGVRVPTEAENFLFTTLSRPALGPTQPPIQWEQGALFLWVKRPCSENDNSPPFRAEVKNAWSCTSTPPIRLRGILYHVEKLYYELSATSRRLTKWQGLNLDDAWRHFQSMLRWKVKM
jgi:hypothetical protein